MNIFTCLNASNKFVLPSNTFAFVKFAISSNCVLSADPNIMLNIGISLFICLYTD